MQRLWFFTVGGVLAVAPIFIVYNLTVPVPQFRKGTFADYQGFALTWLVVIAGGILGLIIASGAGLVWKGLKSSAGGR
jgi:hypothetical protein